MAITYEQIILAPIEIVFDFLDDNDKMMDWMEGVEEITFPDGENRDDPVGVKWRIAIREGGHVTWYDGVTTAYEKPTHLGIRMSNKHFAVDVDYRLSSIPDGTQLDYSADFAHTSMLAKIMGVLFGWLTKSILKKQMTALKKVAEDAAS